MIFFLLLIINLNTFSCFFNNYFKNYFGNRIIENKCKFDYPKYIVDNKNILHKIDDQNLRNDIITISPSGLYGFYTFGVSSVLKENIDMSKYILSGVSSGSWNTLYLSFNGNDDNFKQNLLKENFIGCKSIMDFQNKMKNSILKNYEIKDFNTQKTYITLNGYHKKEMKTLLYNNFTDLEDMVNCCIGSSNIPYITGDIIYNYRDVLAFDGGFSENPYLVKEKDSVLHISKDMYGRYKNIHNSFDTSLNLIELYENGVKDAKKNLHRLNI
jgi:hypothetical protein